MMEISPERANSRYAEHTPGDSLLLAGENLGELGVDVHGLVWYHDLCDRPPLFYVSY